MLFTRSFAIFVAGGCALFALRWVNPALAWIGWTYDGCLVFFLALDYRLTPRPSSLHAQRVISDSSLPLGIETQTETRGMGEEKLSLGVDNRICLLLRNRSPLSLQVTVKDEPPAGFEVSTKTNVVTMGPLAQASVTYHVRPSHRGNYHFGDINLRYGSLLGLLIRQTRIAAGQEVKVYPNLLDVRKYDLLARRGRLLELGIRAAALRGRGTEFESLREYHLDDEYRHINWNATARRGKLISSQFQVERSQNILILLDCGRMMATEVFVPGSRSTGTMTKLDYAINATLMISYVASVMDDKVGLLSFSDEVHTYLPPRKGKHQVYRIMESLYPLESDLLEPDYRVAFHYLKARIPKRSLVILFTDLVDADISREMLTHLAAVHPVHLPICVTVSSREILDMAAAIPAESQQVYEKAMAVHVLKEREEALRVLRSRGVFIVDVPPEQLSVAVVNKYLELKSRMML